MDFLDFFLILFQSICLDCFLFFLDFLWMFWILFKILRLLIKVTKVTTGHQKWPKIGHNSIMHFFGQNPPQELEIGPRLF